MSIKKARVVNHERMTASLLQALREEGYTATPGADQHTPTSSNTSISVEQPPSLIDVSSVDGQPTSVEAHGQGSPSLLSQLGATISRWRSGG